MTGVPNESKVAGNRSAQFRVTTVAQQSFRVTLCVTFILGECHFLLNITFQFYVTGLMQLVYSLLWPALVRTVSQRIYVPRGNDVGK
jgi:hypothetical protein